MSIFGKIFGNRSDKSKDLSEKKEVMINISSVSKDKIPSSSKIIYSSEIPKYCSIGNLIFEKRFHEAIELGKKLLEKTPHRSMIYFKHLLALII